MRLTIFSRVALIALVVGFVLAAWHLFLTDNTVESVGFSEDSFLLVNPGMSREKVLDLLGEPLGESCNKGRGELWIYPLGAAIRSGQISSVEFDANGLVKRVSSVGSAAQGGVGPGATKEAVLAAFGKPSVRREPISCIMFFTRQRENGPGRTRVRYILFGKNDKVVEAVKRTEWD